jgi:hypothetical protein
MTYGGILMDEQHDTQTIFMAKNLNGFYANVPNANILNGMKCVWIDEQAYLNYMNALNVTIYTDGVITIFSGLTSTLRSSPENDDI